MSSNVNVVGYLVTKKIAFYMLFNVFMNSVAIGSTYGYTIAKNDSLPLPLPSTGYFRNT